MEQQKTQWLHARLSADEYNLLLKHFKATTCRKLSQYIRAKLFDKNMTTLHRNKSLDDFMTELMLLRTELNKIGNNLNQAVRRLNSMRPDSDFSAWAATYDSTRQAVANQVVQINEQLKKFSETWLQNSAPDHH